MSEEAEVEDLNATTQEKFMIMMNDRIGNIEEQLFKLTNMFETVIKYITDEYISTTMNIPTRLYPNIDEDFLNKIVKGVDLTNHVKIKKIWILFSNISDYNNTIIIYIQLDKPIILNKLSSNINKYILSELNLSSSYRYI